MKKIKFIYLYRDAGNYKSWGETVFNDPDGIGAEAAAERLTVAFDSGSFFVARQIDVPDVFFEDINDDDHCLNEFHVLELTSEPVNDPRSLVGFIERVESESKRGWQAFLRQGN